MEYIIAIPTYKRVETLHTKTLAYLQQCNIPNNRIYLFVANEEEYRAYSKEYHHLGYRIIIGVPTITAQRNFITNYFDEGVPIVQMDDDIEAIYQKVDDKKYQPFYELDTFIKEAFATCLKHNTKLWGISAVLNALFMKHGYSTNLKFCVGVFCGFINDKTLLQTVSVKEDYERTIQYYQKYGSVIRFNGYAPKTKYYKEAGGLQGIRTPAMSQQAADMLIQKYPKYVKVNTARKGDNTEIRLYHNPKKEVAEQPTLF